MKKGLGKLSLGDLSGPGLQDSRNACKGSYKLPTNKFSYGQ